ncbi:beta-glucosidase 18-like [Cucumis melo var. makuwa]|uniref:Beta-glucosidase 18-like n=1 Tax=Cucumis melo var. makuwa TaxID=1194695 RepID=A0A5A7UPN3_CUCMM|nr:beta-glucosidase 18-like [Cucumis melo var. makuwa]
MVAILGYKKGNFPPAHCSPPFGNCSMGNSDREPLIVMHNQLLAHAKAVSLYRTHFQASGSIGITISMQMYEPLDQQLDRKAADRFLAFHVGWIYDPIVYGDYPKKMREILGSELPSFSDEDKKYIKGSLDFISINHYTTKYVKDCFHSSCTDEANRPINAFTETTPYRNGILIGDQMGMPGLYVVPRGMEKVINYIKQKYPNQSIFVTENVSSILKAHSLFGHIDDTLPCPPKHLPSSTLGTNSEINPEYLQWLSRDQALITLINTTLSSSSLAHVVGSVSSKALWLSLEKCYSSNTQSNILDLSIDQYTSRIKALVDKLVAASVSLEDEEILVHTFNGLPTAFNAFRTSIRTRSDNISLEELHTLLISEETTMAKTSAIEAIPTPMAAFHSPQHHDSRG